MLFQTATIDSAFLVFRKVILALRGSGWPNNVSSARHAQSAKRGSSFARGYGEAGALRLPRSSNSASGGVHRQSEARPAFAQGYGAAGGALGLKRGKAFFRANKWARIRNRCVVARDQISIMEGDEWRDRKLGVET